MAVILMIDDDPMLTGLMAQLFHRVGHEVHSARSGEAGVTMAMRIMPDLILLDQSLPGCSGLETMKKLRSIQHLAEIPMVFYTATVDPEVHTDALAQGARGFWWKGTAGFEDIRHRIELLIGPTRRSLTPIAAAAAMVAAARLGGIVALGVGINALSGVTSMAG